jgi:hypothetical protein
VQHLLEADGKDMDRTDSRDKFNTAIDALMYNEHISPYVGHDNTFRLLAKAKVKVNRGSKVDKEGEFAATRMKKKKVRVVVPCFVFAHCLFFVRGVFVACVSGIAFRSSFLFVFADDRVRSFV